MTPSSSKTTEPKNLIPQDSTILDALHRLQCFESSDAMTLFVIDTNGRLLGTVTDGDIRRRLIKCENLNDLVSSAMNAKPKFIFKSEISLHRIVELRDEHSIDVLPILTREGVIVDTLDLRKCRSFIPAHAVLMVGGEGQRLRPLTNNCPKPMLEIAGQPILFHTIDRLRKYGISRFTLCIRYLADQIINYCGDGQQWNIQIDYVHENEPLGTIGGACGIDYEHDHVLVMNGDLLTNINFEDFFLFHERTDSTATVAAFQRKVQIPFAVLGMDDFTVNSVTEKPDYEFWCNAGIYLFKSEALRSMEFLCPLHATDALTRLKEDGSQVSVYPMYAYWKDLGTSNDLAQARLEFPYINF